MLSEISSHDNNCAPAIIEISDIDNVSKPHNEEIRIFLTKNMFYFRYRANQQLVTFTMSKQFSRLPSTVVPSHYVIKLKPDLVKHTFEGIKLYKICEI